MDVCLCPLLHTHVTSLCTYVTSSYTYVTSSYAYGGNHECMPLSTPAHTCHIIIHLCHIIIHMSHHHTHMEEIMDVCLCPLLHTHTHTIRHIGVCIYVSKSVQHIITTRRSTNQKKKTHRPIHTREHAPGGVLLRSVLQVRHLTLLNLFQPLGVGFRLRLFYLRVSHHHMRASHDHVRASHHHMRVSHHHITCTLPPPPFYLCELLCVRSFVCMCVCVCVCVCVCARVR